MKTGETIIVAYRSNALLPGDKQVEDAAQEIPLATSGEWIVGVFPGSVRGGNFTLGIAAIHDNPVAPTAIAAAVGDQLAHDPIFESYTGAFDSTDVSIVSIDGQSVAGLQSFVLGPLGNAPVETDIFVNGIKKDVSKIAGDVATVFEYPKTSLATIGLLALGVLLAYGYAVGRGGKA